MINGHTKVTDQQAQRPNTWALTPPPPPLQQFYQYAQQLLFALHYQAQIARTMQSTYALPAMLQQHHQALWALNQAMYPGPPGQGAGRQLGDEEIAGLLSEVFQANPMAGLTDVQVSVTRQEVTLGGIVPSAYAKRSADALAWQCPGVADVHNTLEIRSRRSGKATSGQTVRERVTR